MEPGAAGRRPSGRLVFDIGMLAEHGGQAVGIARVVRELARWARANLDGVTFVFFDRDMRAFRTVAPAWVDELIEGRALVDFSTLSREEAHSGPTRAPGGVGRSLALWFRNPRRRAIVAIERARIDGRLPASTADALLAWLMSAKDRRALTDPSGRRRVLLPFDRAAGPVFVARPGDMLLFAGVNWSAALVDALARERRRVGMLVAFVSYDIIALTHPRFFKPDAVAAFRDIFHRIIPVADLVMVTARSVADDLGRYCAGNGLALPPVRLFQPGSDLVDAGAAATALPHGLGPGCYALFVSTIEPRKNHALLIAAWRRLLAEGVPQRTGFRLVFVGRRGWMVDELMADIEADAALAALLVVLPGVDDAGLAALYRDAAFTLYPSFSEGYGLPVVESFRYGKAVLASNGGALAEVVGDFSPAIDPHDLDAWVDHLRRWIVDPSARAPYEIAIGERYRHPDWQEAAATFFAMLDDARKPAEAGAKPPNGAEENAEGSRPVGRPADPEDRS